MARERSALTAIKSVVPTDEPEAGINPKAILKISVFLEQGIYKRIKRAALDQDKTVTEFLNEFLDKGLPRY